MISWLERLLGETQAKLLALLRRSHHSITSLAKALGLTDNAVRTHVAVLRRDGLVEDVGAQRDTGGKPARMYGLTRDGEELFPKAYALVLGRVLDEISRREGREQTLDLLRAIGADLAAEAKVTGSLDPKKRVDVAANLLRSLGADIEVQREGRGWRLQGYACPFSAVTSEHAEACALAQALVTEIVGQPVTECCQRGTHPRCAFAIAS